MRHRISAGVIVAHRGRILLVRHVRPGVHDFWVAPGGGVEGTEDLRAAARREAWEECGLRVETREIAYVEELVLDGVRMCKTWFVGRLVDHPPDAPFESIALDVSHGEAARESIVEAAFLAREEFVGKTIFPPMLRDAYWEDAATGFAFPRLVSRLTEAGE